MKEQEKLGDSDMKGSGRLRLVTEAVTISKIHNLVTTSANRELFQFNTRID